ncbi:MAG: hypothetical protein IKF09_00720 [Clostridiales bacterium]|nr:hypothetical protein [Clostridiales bacterium]
MNQALITCAGNAVGSVLKNTHCTITLSGWPAAAAVIVSAFTLSGTVVAVVAINDHSKNNDLVIDDDRGSY